MENLEKTQPKHNDSDQTLKWQQKLLPWFIIMPTVLMAVFIYLASQQLVKFNNALETKPDSLLVGAILPNPNTLEFSNKNLDYQKYLQWITLTKLEQESLYRRYNQGGLLLMSRIYTKYLGFFTGMIMAIVGAVFIIGKIREGTSKIEGSANELMKFSIVSSSPGIIFGVLGTFLMIATIMTHNKIEIQDRPLYLNATTIMSTELIHSMGQDNSADSTKTKKVEDIVNDIDNLWDIQSRETNDD